jgi:hypothetical protein
MSIVGFAVNLQLLAASGFVGEKALEYPLDPPGWVPAARDGLLEEAFTHQRGKLGVPSAPGLGFRIDPRALAKHGERFFVMDRKRLIWFSLRARGIKASLEIERARRARPAESARPSPRSR